MKTLKNFFHAVIILSGLILGTSLAIYSQNMAVWNFDGSVTTPSFTEMNCIAGPASFGPGVVIGVPAYVQGNPTTGLAYTASSWSIGTANPNKYIEFTIGPITNYMMTLTSFSFNFRRSATGIRAWEIRSSMDDFITVLASGTNPDNTDWHYGSAALPLTFENLTVNTSFRIYGYNSEATGGTCRFDNVYFTGTVEELPPVPLSDWAVVIGLVLISTLVVIRYSKRA